MVKTLVKLLIAAALLNACVRVGTTAWAYYQLKDAVNEMILFGANVSTSDLQARIVDKAGELDIPLDPADVDVQRDGAQTSVDLHYTQPVELLPGYPYPVKLAFQADAVAARPTTMKDVLGQP